KTPTTKTPTFGILTTAKPPTTVPTVIVETVTCSKNNNVSPVCCGDKRGLYQDYWRSGPGGGVPPRCSSLALIKKKSGCTNKTKLRDVYFNRFNSVDDFCKSNGWGKAVYDPA
ncbi:hypothetical protein, partial [Endozoicomonas sp. ALC013]|uniref:hypothetical protein n=1 Tax=Endozoicomonas sp. ALC013 TaxID=3403076 RepID=UPI003BB69CCD